MAELWNKLRRIRGFPLICAAAVLGLLLLLLPGNASIRTEDGASSTLPKEISTLSAYETALAHKIAQMTNALLGCTDAEVLVRLEAIPAEKEHTYFGSAASGDVTVVPKPVGIAVVCRGGGDASVELRVVDMLTAVFDIPAARIYVGEKRFGGMG